MIRALLANDRRDSRVLSRVRVPSIAEEDRKRLLRKCKRFVKQRKSLTNRVKEGSEIPDHAPCESE
ncbi:MAG: hypothetical protein OXF88_03695, partial [Rhodobacteraceae bacterium]|nr:hypothetical protein [Paracoccaceae bacterium]